jgi:hypothetical protein
LTPVYDHQASRVNLISCGVIGLKMVQRYTRPVTFEDSLKYYRVLLGYEVHHMLSARWHVFGDCRKTEGSPLYFVGDPQDAIGAYIR